MTPNRQDTFRERWADRKPLMWYIAVVSTLTLTSSVMEMRGVW